MKAKIFLLGLSIIFLVSGCTKENVNVPPVIPNQVLADSFPEHKREIILPNQTWIFPWYNSLIVPDFYQLDPNLFPTTPFHIYIQKPPSSQWYKVEPFMSVNALFEFIYFEHNQAFYQGGSLYIFYYGTDVSTRPTIKILF
ncbi:MAG: hypothetical protein ABIT96_02895 [Ferruginibacter sp.]